MPSYRPVLPDLAGGLAVRRARYPDFLAHRPYHRSDLDGDHLARLLHLLARPWLCRPISAQVHLDGSSFASVAQAIVFGIFSYVGFESAATLGKETRNPKTIIPRAVILTPIIAGLFFIFTTYIISQGFGDDAGKLGASSGPLSDLVAGKSTVLTNLVYLGAAISCFACALASINAFSRILFSLGRYRFVHRGLGTVHSAHQTPHVAATIGVIINFLVCAAFSSQANPDLLGYFGTIASFGFIIVYMLCSIAAPVLLRKTGEAKPGDYAMGALGTVLMILSLVGSLYPVPPYPYNILPYGFALYMLFGDRLVLSS